jgi:hypothetical protein
VTAGSVGTVTVGTGTGSSGAVTVGTGTGSSGAVTVGGWGICTGGMAGSVAVTVVIVFSTASRAGPLGVADGGGAVRAGAGSGTFAAGGAAFAAGRSKPGVLCAFGPAAARAFAEAGATRRAASLAIAGADDWTRAS